MRNRVKTFGSDERGNFTVLFSLTAVAMALTLGLGLDYYAGLSAKSRLEAAADAAALAAVNAAKTYYAQNSGKFTEAQLQANAIAAGKATGLRAFSANVGSTVLTAPIAPTIDLAFDSLKFNATVTWSGSTQTFLGSLSGVKTLALGGTAAAVSQLPLYEDFYVLTDVSGSMGIPTNPSDQLLLMQTSPDNVASNWFYTNYGPCQFACHFPGNKAFDYTQQPTGSGGVRIPLKLNDAGTALSNLLTTANSTKVIANQFRIGIYTYINDVIQAGALSSDLTASGPAGKAAANLANYLDAGGTNGGMNSGGTHLNSLWNEFKVFLNPVGDGGKAATPKPFIILITDGVDNKQSYAGGTWSAGGSQPVLPDTTSAASVCAAAKAANYTVAVLLIPYDPIQKPQAWFANDEDDIVNYYIDPTLYPKPTSPVTQTVPPGSNVAVNMQACASPGYFFSASSASAINAAMQQIFFQATSAARLTQ